MAICCVVLLFSALGSKALLRPGAYIVFLDVGQGDATLIQLPDSTTILIDAGPDAGIVEQIGRALPFFDHTIELAIATHPDTDHYAGFASLLPRYTIREFWTAGEKGGAWDVFLEDVLQRGIFVHRPHPGERVTFTAQATLDVFWPPDPFSGDSNAGSIITMFTYGTQRFLLTGDAPMDVEERLVVAAVDVRTDVLKLGHHGSKSSSSSTFLQAVQPRIAIISAGTENRYGHPHAEVLTRVKEQGIPYLRTDIFGSVLLVFDEPLFAQHLDKICLFC